MPCFARPRARAHSARIAAASLSGSPDAAHGAARSTPPFFECSAPERCGQACRPEFVGKSLVQPGPHEFVIRVMLPDVACLPRRLRVMLQECHRLARAVEPRPKERDAAEEHAVVTGGDMLRISTGGKHCGRAKDGARTNTGIATEHPFDGVHRERNKAVELAALIAQVVAQAIRAHGDSCRLPAQSRRCPLEEVGRPVIVGIKEGNKGGITDCGQPGISRCCRTGVKSPYQNRAERAAALAYPRVDTVWGAIRRTVIHNNDGLGNPCLRPNAFEATHHEPRAIPDGDDDADGEIGQAHELAVIGMVWSMSPTADEAIVRLAGPSRGLTQEARAQDRPARSRQRRPPRQQRCFRTIYASAVSCLAHELLEYIALPPPRHRRLTSNWTLL